jgi:hypothetical protein
MCRVEIGVDTKQQTMTSLAFPFDREALQALESYAKLGYDYLQLKIGRLTTHARSYSKSFYIIFIPSSWFVNVDNFFGLYL